MARGFTCDREIASEEAHVYPVELQAGQFLQVSVQENGIDLQVQITDTSGEVLVGVDSLPAAEAREELALVAAENGHYELRVIASERDDPGRYRLAVDALRKPNEEDRLLAEAVAATWNGQHVDSGDHDPIPILERALRLWGEVGNPKKSAEVLYLRGEQRYSRGKYEPAAADYQRSAALWGQLPNRSAKVLQAVLLNKAGRCLRHLERRQAARTVYGQALDLARSLEDPGLQAKNLNMLGQLDVEDGEVSPGIARLLQALALARQARDHTTEGVILNNLAWAYEQTAQMQKALEFYQQALGLARGSSNRKAEAQYLNNLGETYRFLGDWEQAFGCYQRAVELSDALSPHDAGTVLINLSEAHRQQGRLDHAWDLLDRALEVGCRGDSRRVRVFARGHLAFLLLRMQQPSGAVEHARRAVELAGSLEEQTFARYALGSALRDLGESEPARTELTTALALAHRRADGAREAEIDLALARLDRDEGDLDAAIRRVRAAIELIESHRGGVVDLQLKTSLLASRQDYYELAIDILMDLHAQRPRKGFASEGLRTSESARARGLLDILNEAQADVRQATDPALLRKEQELRDGMNARDFQLRELLSQEDPDPEKLAEAERKRDQAADEYQRVRVALLQGSPRYAALAQPQPPDVAEIQARLLDGEATLLEYSLGTRRSHLWVVTPDAFGTFELLGRKRIEEAARRWYELVTVRGNRLPGESGLDWKRRVAAADAEAEKAGRELAELILQPAEKLLAGRTLLIVADGALQYIPFAALPVAAAGARLIERHEVVNLPSASVLAVMRREPQTAHRPARTLAVFADPIFERNDERLARGLAQPASRPPAPALPIRRGAEGRESREKGIDLSSLRRLTYSQREADAIAALLPAGEVFKAVGFEASRSAVFAGGLAGYRYVHFATHGVLDSRDPAFSGLVLSLYDPRGERQDGVLRLHDIYNLRLAADLVVLSACRTALGQEIRGEGLVGLTRGFLYAGAARVLATLWSVEDRPTAALMASFYRGMLHDGLSPAAALRQAQLAMARAGKSPYYWAGFSLQGEWR